MYVYLLRQKTNISQNIFEIELQDIRHFNEIWLWIQQKQ